MKQDTMRRPPSHIFVIRHGSRLDAADKQWHLTSPTPYDTPLTYGGFQQARQVGNHISSLLEQAKVDAEVSRNGEVISGRRRRFRIVIHTSPFLRCVQTSIGIASGLSQTPLGSIYQPSDLIVSRSASNTTTIHYNQHQQQQQPPIKSALLRIDPFLGEWLAPEYFECITPPPGSALMVGSAKAELLRRDDYSMYIEQVPTTTHRSTRSSSSLWNSSPSPNPTDSGLPPSRSGNASNTTPAVPTLRVAPRQRTGYVAPQPMYAVSSRDKIPDGLVAHARDACTMIDYQWDSNREPVDFGDGGTFGEEWATMHKRFRVGLKKLLNWYATTDKADELQSMQRQREDNSKNYSDAEDSQDESEQNEQNEQNDEDVETVVILVSHGAGCNALIGAITHQPVLLDVGIASISMAVRKQNLDYSQLFPRTRPEDLTASQSLVSVDQMYEIRLSAITEHLRPGTATPISARPSSASSSWSPAGNSVRRGRTGTVGSNAGGPVSNPFIFHDSAPVVGTRDTSATTFAENFPPQDSTSGNSRQASGSATNNRQSLSSISNSDNDPWSNNAPTRGLWAPVSSSSLSFMDDGDTDGPVADYDSFLPDFDNKRFNEPLGERKNVAIGEISGASSPEFAPAVQPPSIQPCSAFAAPPNRPILSAPIRLNNADFEVKRLAEEVNYGQLGDALGGLWGFSLPSSEAERFL